MFRLVGFLLLLALLGISSSQPQRETIQKAEQRNPGKPIASPHCKGPAGLDSWALLYPQSDSKLSAGPDSLPLAIVIARRGHVIRRIRGSAILWQWFFVDGQNVAFEDGAHHFVTVCKLLNLSSGKIVAEYDCFNPPKDPPGWVRMLLDGKSTCWGRATK